MKVLKSGDIIYANTHADFLNKVFKTDYKGWMKCVWPYKGDTIVWMVRFNKIVDGWRNTFVKVNGEDRVKEENVYHKETWNNNPVSCIHSRRIVIEVDDSSTFRKYVFRGVYTYLEKESDPYSIRYHKKESDEVTIY